MATNKTTQNKAAKKKQQTKSNLPLCIVAAAAVCIAAAILLIPRLTSQSKDAESSGGSSSSASGDSGTVQKIEAGGSLIIPTSEVSSTAKFYTVEVDGTEMEIIAVEDSSGYIRTAFNTCQICYSSGRGYYVQSGDALVCQNCGNRFTIDQVEIQSGGCNPWPIFEENKTISDDSIEISYDFLKESKDIFANWKTSY